MWIVAAGSDRVLLNYPLPAHGVLNNVHLNIHVLGPEGVQFNQVVMYGLSGFVLPVPDPDSGIAVDTLWDNLVPKDIDSAQGVFDLDTGATDATPEFEMGEPDWSGIFDVAAMEPLEIFRRRKMLSTLNGMVNYEAVPAAADLWVPGDLVKTHVGRKVRVGTPSMVLFGLSSPSLDETNQTTPTVPSETEWILLQYLEIALDQAFMYLIGLVESGAESPYLESAGFIAELLEDDAYEATAGGFSPVSWTVFSQGTFDITVPGRKVQSSISSEG